MRGINNLPVEEITDIVEDIEDVNLGDEPEKEEIQGLETLTPEQEADKKYTEYIQNYNKQQPEPSFMSETDNLEEAIEW